MRVGRWRGMIRAVLSVVLAAGLWSAVAPVARADGVEMLMVPSAAMGRDIPVAFQGGGPHAVVLLDAFNAGPDVSNWVGAGAFNTLAGKGISVAAPAGGAWSMYTNWEQDGSKQWETFLADELPDWLAANKGLAPDRARHRRRRPGRHGGVDDGGVPPRPVPLRRLAVGFPDPVEHVHERRDHRGLAQFGGVDIRNMWGLPQLGRWKWHDPDVHVQLLADNNTRLWVFSPPPSAAATPRR